MAEEFTKMLYMMLKTSEPNGNEKIISAAVSTGTIHEGDLILYGSPSTPR